MNTKLFEHYSPFIRALSAAELNGTPALNAKLCLAREGNIEVCYAPFEFVNSKARVVIVGITPGRTQMLNALKEARSQLDQGADAMLPYSCETNRQLLRCNATQPGWTARLRWY